MSPGASGATGIPLVQLLAGVVRAVKPAAILCIDSLCTSDPRPAGAHGTDLGHGAVPRPA